MYAAGCSTVEPMNNVTQVSYTSDSGTILPELQWHEEIVITKSKVSLTRNGRVADTQINIRLISCQHCRRWPAL
jgi:hypothetical protein